MSYAKRLRERLSEPGILVVPGGGSPLEIRLIEELGFEAAYVSGYATAAARYGMPDIGLIAYAEVENNVIAARRATNLPLIVDCDTGYGDVINVRHTVRGMEMLGVAAIQIEDQQWPKRCGHMDGKSVVSQETALKKVQAAVAARTNPDTLIIARTDSRGPLGLDEAIVRCKMFRDAGADILFVDGPESDTELERIGQTVDAPLLANMSETGKTPLHSAEELETLGYKIALFPSSTVRLAIKAVGDFLADLKQTGDSRSWLDRMASLETTNRALGVETIRAFDDAISARRRKP